MKKRLVTLLLAALVFGGATAVSTVVYADELGYEVCVEAGNDDLFRPFNLLDDASVRPK